MFEPGGRYGHSPGQWWADPDLLWEVACGRQPQPIMTEAIRDELHFRYWESGGAKIGTAKRLTSWPLPTWEHGPVKIVRLEDAKQVVKGYLTGDPA
jgi:hypothetical protein